MYSVDSDRANEQISRRIRRLRSAAEEARADADRAMATAARRVVDAAPLVPRLLGRVSGTAIRAVARTVYRHPVSALLIAGVIVGTVWYHRPRRQGAT